MTTPRFSKMDLVVRDLMTSQPFHENGRRVTHDLSDISLIGAHVSARVQNDPIALFFQATNFLHDARQCTYRSVRLTRFAPPCQRTVDINNNYFFLGDHRVTQPQGCNGVLTEGRAPHEDLRARSDVDRPAVAGAECIREAFAVSLESATGFFERFAMSYPVFKLGLW